MQFVIVNRDENSNEKECAEKIDSQHWESKEKIFAVSESGISKNDLSVTKKIKNNGAERTTFYPGDKVEIEITLDNKGSESVAYFFDETLGIFLTDISSESCTQSNSQLRCSGNVDQGKQEIINYKGTVSSSELGNLVLERTPVQYNLENMVSQTNSTQNESDTVIRIHDPIHAFPSIILDKSSLKPGEMTTAKFTLENRGIQFFHANNTLVIDNALEFVNDVNSNSINHIFGNIHPGEIKEFSTKLQAKENNQFLISTKQTVEFDSLIFNLVYDGTDWKFTYVDPPVNVKEEISVEPVPGNALLPLIKNWPYLIVMVAALILLVQFKRNSFPFRPYKTSVSKL